MANLMRRRNPPRTLGEHLALAAPAHTDLILAAYRHLYPDKEWGGWTGGVLLAAIERFLRRRLWPSPSRGEAAAHEAGHLTLSARLGLDPRGVEIWGKRDLRGWGGGMSCLGPPFFHSPINPQDDADLLWRVAAAMLAGPIAEDRWGDEGRAIANVGELIAASAWAYKAAELSGRDPGEVWREVLGARYRS